MTARVWDWLSMTATCVCNVVDCFMMCMRTCWKVMPQLFKKQTHRVIWPKLLLLNWTISHFCVKFHNSATRDLWITAVKTVQWKETMPVQNKQHVVIEYLTAENIPLNDNDWWMRVVYGDNCADISTVRCWAAWVHNASKPWDIQHIQYVTISLHLLILENSIHKTKYLVS